MLHFLFLKTLLLKALAAFFFFSSLSITVCQALSSLRFCSEFSTMKAQRGTVFLKLLHLSDFTEFGPSSETVSQVLLAPLSDFAHSVAPSAHREGHGERERDTICQGLAPLRFCSQSTTIKAERETLLCQALFASHILLRTAPSKHRERGRETHTHRLPSSSLSLKFCRV